MTNIFSKIINKKILSLKRFVFLCFVVFFLVVFISPISALTFSLGDFDPSKIFSNDKNNTTRVFAGLKENATEMVKERNQVQKVFDNHDGTKQYIVSSGPLHYQEGDKWEEIDTRILSVVGGNGFEMAKSIYKAKFNKYFRSDKIVKIEKDGYGVSVKPGDLFWINSKGDKEIIASPQPVKGKADGNKITYKNAYGKGLDFSYETNDISLVKKLIVDEFQSLPSPSQKILEGDEPVLALNIEFDLEKEMDVYIGDELWDGEEIKVKGKDIEFQKDGNIIWRFASPKAWSNTNVDEAIDGELILSLDGGKIQVTVLFPFSWLKTADYPVTIDPDTYYGETTDGWLLGQNATYSVARDNSTNLVATYIRVGQYPTYTIARGYLEFNTSGINDDMAVTQANLYLMAINDSSLTDFTLRIHKYNWTSPLAAGTREADYDGALASTFDANWKNTADIFPFQLYGSDNLDTTWIQKGETKTKYALLSDRDVIGSGTAPTQSEWINIADQGNATPEYRPYLSITAALPLPTLTQSAYKWFSQTSSAGSVTSGPNSPGTMANDSSVGELDWTNPDNAKVADGTSCAYVVSAFGGYENSVRLVIGDSVSGDDKSTSAPLTSGVGCGATSYRSYGGSSDLWGLSLNSTDVNSSNFGVVYSTRSGSDVVSHYLKATNFGFNIPAGSTINGILIEVKQSVETDPLLRSYVDHVRMTVYYSQSIIGIGRGAIMNQSMTAPAQGTPFRLRLLNHVGTADIAQNATTSILQFAQKSGTCDTAFSGESYTSLSSTTGAIRYYDNTSLTDGVALTANYEDPRHASSTTTGIGHDTVRNQVYSEGSNNFTNSQSAISAGEDGLWEFSLVDYSAPPGTSYCFRAVQEGGGLYDGGYSVIPEITTALPTKILLRGNVKLRQVKFR
jgi:hypothetical protein